MGYVGDSLGHVREGLGKPISMGVSGLVASASGFGWDGYRSGRQVQNLRVV